MIAAIDTDTVCSLEEQGEKQRLVVHPPVLLHKLQSHSNRSLKWMNETYIPRRRTNINLSLFAFSDPPCDISLLTLGLKKIQQAKKKLLRKQGYLWGGFIGRLRNLNFGYRLQSWLYQVTFRSPSSPIQDCPTGASLPGLH